MIDQNLKWFEPLWRRVLVLAVCVGWAGFEWFVSRDELWRWLTLALIAYAVWTFFINFKVSDDGEPKS